MGRNKVCRKASLGHLYTLSLHQVVDLAFCFHQKRNLLETRAHPLRVFRLYKPWRNDTHRCSKICELQRKAQIILMKFNEGHSNSSKVKFTFNDFSTRYAPRECRVWPDSLAFNPQIRSELELSGLQSDWNIVRRLQSHFPLDHTIQTTPIRFTWGQRREIFTNLVLFDWKPANYHDRAWATKSCTQGFFCCNLLAIITATLNHFATWASVKPFVFIT